jgi:uncharacterized protein
MAKRKSRNESLLIVFYRNPELGKVKTRLAASIGDGRAYSIYLLLAEHTRKVVEGLRWQKAVYYSSYIDTDDAWSNSDYQKFLQVGNELGEKMQNAFETGFKSGYKSICIIGTDCLDLTGKIVDQAFRQLLSHDVVIGPAVDGGYYLLGMNSLYPTVFKNKSWGRNTVLTETLHDLNVLRLRYCQLELLNDIDRVEDLPPNFQ